MPQRKTPVGAELTPLDLTRQVKDISVTERASFKTCRRRWWLETIENLQPKVPEGMALEFGSGIHEALEAYYLAKASLPSYIQEAASPNILKAALNAWERWYDRADEKLDVIDLPRSAVHELETRLDEFADLGEEMLRGYHQFAKIEDEFTVHAVEGVQTEAGKSWLKKHFKEREFIAEHSESAVILHEESGRLLCPILDPETRAPIKGGPMLTAKIDLIVHRIDPGMKGLWIFDHKTTDRQPSDRGLDFYDQPTAYCYIVWRWLGIMPRGVTYNYQLKQIPKPPRILRNGNLSYAKDQLTTPEQYRAELEERGLMKKGRIKDDNFAGAYEALLSRGWDPFFKRHTAPRSIFEVQSFEKRLFEEWMDMADCRDGELIAYPNFGPPHMPWCTWCPVNTLCQAMEDGSDVKQLKRERFEQAPDRKATKLL